MSFDIGTLYAKVKLDRGDYEHGMKQLPQMAESSFRQVATLAATYLSARALFGFAKAGVSEFSALEEACNKFDNVFKNISATARQVSKALEKDFGLSEQSAKEMLSGTGDLLTGFGFAEDAALELSDRAARLGADLASYTNYAGGAKGASEALTYAMLGETERAKALGVVIRQDSDEYIRLVEHYQKAEGRTLLQAKALAALKIATDQSGNAIGDWSRPGETLAQTQMKITENSRRATAALGEELARGVHPLLKGYNDLLKGWSDMDSTSRRMLLDIAALSGGLLLLQTNAGKAANDWVRLAALKLTGDDPALAAARVSAAEEVKRAQAEKTFRTQQRHAARSVMLQKQEAAAAAQTALAVEQANLRKIQSYAEYARYQHALQFGSGEGYRPDPALEKSQKMVAKLSEDAAKAQRELTEATLDFSKASVAAGAAETAHAAAVTKMNVAMKAGRGVAGLFARGLNSVKAAARGLLASLGPIGIVLLTFQAISAVANLISGRLDKASNAARKFAEEAAATRAGQDTAAAKDQARVDRLKELASEGKLLSAGQRESAGLIRELRKTYGDFGVVLDETTGKVVAQTGAFDQLTGRIKKGSEEIARRSVEDQKRNLDQQKKQFDQKYGFGFVQKYRYGDLSSEQWRKTAPRLDQNTQEQLKKIFEAEDRLREEANRLKEIQEGKIAEEERKKAATKEQQDALKSLDKTRWNIEFDTGDSRQQLQMLQKEIDALKKDQLISFGLSPAELSLLSRQEKEKLLNDREREKQYSTEELQRQEKIVELEARRNEIRRRSAGIVAEEKKEEEGHRERQKEQKDRRTVEQEIRILEHEGDTEGVGRVIERELTAARRALGLLKEEYEKVKSDADMDNFRSQAEEEKIAAAKRKWREAEELEASWKERAFSNALADTRDKEAVGAWSSSVLSGMLGGAKPAEETARNTAEANRILKEVRKEIKARNESGGGVVLQ